MNPIGEKIKEIRKSKGISQTVVADTCGIKQSSYANIENGKTHNISIEVGKGIAKTLEIPFGELFEVDSYESSNINLTNQITEFRNTINELKKQLEDKELIIHLLKKENQKLTEMQAWDTVFEMFHALLDLEIAFKWGEPNEDEKKEIRRQIESNTALLQEEINESLKLRYISHETLLSIFLDAGLDDIIEDELSTKENYIKNCTAYINQFLTVSEKQVREYIENNVITKWDTKKRRKRALQLKRLIRRGAFEYKKSRK